MCWKLFGNLYALYYILLDTIQGRNICCIGVNNKVTAGDVGVLWEAVMGYSEWVPGWTE